MELNINNGRMIKVRNSMRQVKKGNGIKLSKSLYRAVMDLPRGKHRNKALAKLIFSDDKLGRAMAKLMKRGKVSITIN